MQNMERNVMSYQIDSRPSKARIKSPPLSGGEVARKTEEKGRGLSERSEFRRPRRRLRRQTQKPDNRGGASWFVLLAAEKNEQAQINDISIPLLWQLLFLRREVKRLDRISDCIFNPSPYRHSPYLIFDEQREKIKNGISHFCIRIDFKLLPCVAPAI